MQLLRAISGQVSICRGALVSTLHSLCSIAEHELTALLQCSAVYMSRLLESRTGAALILPMSYVLEQNVAMQDCASQVQQLAPVQGFVMACP